jgi:hypothetical protein
MSDFPERQRIRPTVEGRARLLAAIEAVSPPHVVDVGTLGEYAEMVVVRGRAEADRQFPAVAIHLGEGCPSCADDLRELTALAGAPDPLPPPTSASSTTDERVRDQSNVPAGGPDSTDYPGPDSAVGWRRDLPRSALDSGIHIADLPDPRAAEAAELARRQRLRKLRDWLLVAAAASILLIGLSLVGMAYLAQNAPGPARLGLTPLPATTPAPGGAERAEPSGMACPATHPLKGNRSSMIYHRPGAEFYEQTRPEDCFASPADAEAAGYRASQR